MIQVVVDVNVFVSAFLWGGTPENLLNTLNDKEIPLLWSEEIFAELSNTLQKPKLAPQMALVNQSLEAILTQVRKKVVMVYPYPDVTDSNIRDPKDLMILAAAVGGLASHIVTGDKDLLSLKVYKGIAIVTPAQFIDLVNDGL
jgi:putative PIN family toxin of toxin-antitoxin system